MRFAAVTLLALGAAAACKRATPPAERPPSEVVVTSVVQRDVPIYGEFVGSLAGYVNATIRPQVKGYLLSREYPEGSSVEKGALLFQIDPRQFQASLDEALGSLGEARAMLGKSEIDVKRFTPLVKQGAVSQQELDNAVQARERNRAAMSVAQANVEQARLDLGWTKVTSPISGIAGIAVAQIGDLVSPQTVLTTVSQLDPIKVEFPISEQEYLMLAQARHIADGETWRGHPDTLELTLANGKTYPHRGTPFVIGREVDPRTGTILIEGRFPNPGNLLRPGQFARVRATIRTADGALLVPQRAVRDVQGSSEVLVVGSGDVVEVRPVTMGERSGTQWIVTKGLRAGERIVVEGLQKVRGGSVVKPVEKPDPATPASASKSG